MVRTLRPGHDARGALLTRPGYRGQPGYPSGATPASKLAPPATGTRPAPPPRPAAAEPVHPVWGYDPNKPPPRPVNPSKACALGKAVEFWRGRDLSADERRLAARIIATAREFEAYLLGPDAQP